MAEEGWKMVLLLRLSPVIPFAPLNYALSLTSISFFAYVWTSALGIIPGTSALGVSSTSCSAHLCCCASL